MCVLLAKGNVSSLSINHIFVIRTSLLRLSLHIILLLCSADVVLGQSKEGKLACENGVLRLYADSLRQLITEFQPEKVLQISDSILQVHEHLICSDIVRIKAWKGFAYEHLFKFEVAIELYNDILKEAKKRQYFEEEIIINISLARVYEAINRPEVCEQHLDELERLFEIHDFESHESHYFVRAASYHRIYKDKETAREYALKALELGEKTGRIGSLAGGNMILGGLTDDIEESIEYAKKASHYCYIEGDFVGHLFLELGIARKYSNSENFEESLQAIKSVLKKGEGLDKNEKIYYQIKEYSSRLKADIFEDLENKDSLVVALKEINNYSTLFGDIANQEKINQLLTDNAVQLEQDKVASAKKSNQILTVGLLCLLAFTIALLRFIFSNRAKSKQIEEQKTTITTQLNELQNLYNYQTTLLSEVHHRIKNNLQLIISLLTLQKAKLGNDIEDGIIEMLSYRITSISLIHEQLYNLKEFENVDIGLYVRDLIKNFKSLTGEKNVDIDHDLDDILLNLETIIPLGLIWSELISNSVKYNSAKEDLIIFFSLTKDGEFYTMNYKDNGVGYPDGQFKANSSGMGFTIVNSLVRQLSGKSKSFNADGAQFSMTFKEKIISPL